MSMEWIRRYYSVPAKRGGRVEYTGCGRSELGTITSASGGQLYIRLDGQKHPLPFHPRWEIRYLDTDQGQTASAGSSDFDWIENQQVGR